MRFLWVGLVVLLLAGSGARGQATGFVRDFGFSGTYRADCWTPLLVHLDSTIAQPAEYQIQVHQQDLDKDTVVFTRTVTLGPQGADGRRDYWVYFLPKPTDGGLTGGPAGAQLGDLLKVHLYDKDGKRHVASLPIQAKADEVESSTGATGESGRSVKLVLVVVGDQARPNIQEQPGAIGTAEVIRYVPILPESLPDHVLGYEAVDAVLWIGGNWGTVAGSPAFAALQQWVRQGGHLAVCNPSDNFEQLDVLASANMLPVVTRTGAGPGAPSAIKVKRRKGVDHVYSLIADGAPATFDGSVWRAIEDSGREFDVARATTVPDAVVEAYVGWAGEDGSAGDRTAFIARRPYGLGAVTWVGQNLGAADVGTGPNPKFQPGVDDRKTSPTNGWPRLWDRVFGWRHTTRTRAEFDAMDERRFTDKKDYAGGIPVDIGAGVARASEHGTRSTAYVFVAVLFFIFYWIVAGPGSYLYLAGKKKKGLSWTTFAGSAVVATFLTIIVVKLLLGGGPEVKHVSVVRLVPTADGSGKFDAAVHSRIGLYIPKDGGQRMSVSEAGPEKVAAVGPYAVPPRWIRDSDAGFTDTARYVVDTDPILTGKAPAAEFPFRSTLKKVQAQWTGQVAEGIQGKPDVIPTGTNPWPLVGELTNATGRDLKDVYFVFTPGWIDSSTADRIVRERDRCLYLPLWKAGEKLDMAKQTDAMSIMSRSPGYQTKVVGVIDPTKRDGWIKYWFEGLPTGFGAEPLDDRKDGFIRSLPLLSLFDRIGPVKATQADSTRPEPVRRGFRDTNMSQQVAAGRLVILAHANEAPVPLNLEINGDRVAGTGTTLYQVALPVGRERVKPAPPATKPASQPATAPAK